MRLQNRVAVITGGAQGIGRAICVGMAREGAKVVVADLQAEKAKVVAAELQAIGTEVIAVEVNVASEMSVKRLADRTFERFGRIDILVNDAGVYLKAPVVSKSEEDWDRTINVNLGGNFLCARAFIPAMRQQKSGRIIGIASSIAHTGAREFADYAASKAAIIGLVKALARELGPEGITVTRFVPARPIRTCRANTGPKKRPWRVCVRLRWATCSSPTILPGRFFFSPAMLRLTSPAKYITSTAVRS